MQNDKSKFWFPVKKYGWGWGPPCTWQGWLVIVVWLLLLAAGGILIAPRNITLFVACITLFVACAVGLGTAMFIILYIKGEKPGWHWGDKDQKSKSSED